VEAVCFAGHENAPAELMLTRIRSYLGGRFWGRAFAQGGLQTWMSEEVVRRYINSSVTGSPNLWPIEWLGTRVPSPFDSAVSLGCGEGALERDLLAKRLCVHILGIDISPEALALARANASGLTGVEYRQGDLNKLELPAASFDAAFFHQSLHHVENLDSCLSVTASALDPGAMVYFDLCRPLSLRMVDGADRRSLRGLRASASCCSQVTATEAPGRLARSHRGREVFGHPGGDRPLL
jgi:SAM-dependent methyltransferase